MMDELEMVKGFCAAESGPSEAAERAARAALARAMAAESRRLERRRRRPARGGWHPALKLRALMLSGVGAVAVAVLVVLLAFGSSPTGPPSAAAAVFERLARVVATQSFTPHRGQYLYVESASTESEFEGSCQVLRPDRRQIWIGANGSGLLRESFGRGSFTSAADRATCASLPGPPSSRVTHSGGTSDLWFAPGCFTLGPTSDWSHLSSNPRVLLRQMRRIDGGPPTHAEDFVHVGDFLRETDAPARVRAAIYRAAALIPGVRLLGPVRDHYGRRGLGFAYTAHGSTSELIFNQRTGELLGEQSTGQIKSWTVYLNDRIVDHVPGRPPAPLKPPCIKTAGKIKHTPRGDVEVGTGYGPTGPSNPELSALSVLQPGHLGPSLSRRLGPALSTEHVYLSQLKGIPRVLFFWASRCAPCQREAPLLERAWRTYGRSRAVLFVGIDTKDTSSHPLSFIRSYGLDFLQLQDKLGFEPPAGETLFLSAQGKVIGHTNGPISEQQLVQRIQAAAHGP